MQLEKALLDLKKLGRIDPKKQDQYFSNVALKVNTKLGGMNHHVCDPLSFKHCLNSLNTVSQLDERAMRWLTKKKTMMVGIDVTHPGPLSRKGTHRSHPSSPAWVIRLCNFQRACISNRQRKKLVMQIPYDVHFVLTDAINL